MIKCYWEVCNWNPVDGSSFLSLYPWAQSMLVWLILYTESELCPVHVSSRRASVLTANRGKPPARRTSLGYAGVIIILSFIGTKLSCPFWPILNSLSHSHYQLLSFSKNRPPSRMINCVIYISSALNDWHLYHVWMFLKGTYGQISKTGHALSPRDYLI